MSAHLVSKASIDGVVALLLAQKHPATVDNGPDRTGATLWNMNRDAVMQCYAHRDDLDDFVITKTEADAYTYTAPPADTSHAALVKNLTCYCYQCCEGDVDKRPLFVELDALADLLRLTVPKTFWEAAPWGLEDE